MASVIASRFGMRTALSRRLRSNAPALLVALAFGLFAAPAHAKNGDYVYLRTAPLSLGLGADPMSPVPGGGAPMHYFDVAGLGFSVAQWEFALNLTAQNLLPKPTEFGVFTLRFTTYWRMFKDGRLRFVEPFVLAGLGGGSAGRQVRVDGTCLTDCKYQTSGWGGGLHLGGGFDVNLPVVEMGNGQRVIFFAGLEVRQELFFHQGLNTFTVFSIPVGFRLD